MQKLKRICVLLISAILILGCSFNSYASINHLMFATDSNAALMTLDLFDDDYGISTFSTLGTVTNTIASTARIPISVYYYDDNGASRSEIVWCTYRDDRWYFSHSVDGIIYMFNISLYRLYDALPSVGNYSMSFDLTSDFSYEYSSLQFASQQTANNVATDFDYIVLDADDWDQFSGDLYVSPVALKLGSVHNMYLRCLVPASQEIQQIAGNFSWRFVNSDEEPMYHIGYDASLQNYQDGVSSSLSGMDSSLSDMSSAMDEQAENIEEVADAIDALRGAMEPHYDNVLTQMHHITEQLHAFYDQVYNNIHLPQFNLLGQIKSAIENLDVNITVDVDGLKSTINTMSTNIQNKLGSVQTALTNKLTSVQTGINNKLQNVQDGINTKLQNVTDHITGGYDNSGMNQENEKLEQSINQYDEVESGIFEDAEGFIGDFEYLSVDSLPLGIIKALAFIGSFLQGIFICMSDFGVIITFSLTMIFVMVVVGYHRIRA